MQLSERYNVYADKILVGQIVFDNHGWWEYQSVVQGSNINRTTQFNMAISDLCTVYSPAIDKTFKITLDPN